jgi:type IV pilus assembly protein PilF
MLGEREKAESNFRRAIALAPNDPSIRANWGAFLCTTGRERESIPEFEQAVRDPLFRSPEIAYIKRRQVHRRARRHEEGRRILPPRAHRFAGERHGELSARAAVVQGRAPQRRARVDPSADAAGHGTAGGALPRLCVERKLGDRQAELSYASQLKNRYPDSAETRQVATGTCE